MTPKKAIEKLGDYKMQSAFEATPEFETALKLGIEALKRHEVAKSLPYPIISDLLPGETID
ncbi:hypothetical protein ES703_45204 [subsurface metagenome]